MGRKIQHQNEQITYNNTTVIYNGENKWNIETKL